MKKFVIVISSFVLLLILIYLAGPKPEAPNLGIPMFKLPGSLTDLERQIDSGEKTTRGIKPDNQARIVWTDSSKKEKTKIAFLYLHGFTASPGDGKPVPTDIARIFGGNLYLFRNAYHGVDLGDSTMQGAKADNFIFEAEKALAIAKSLGDQVIVIGTSLGGALTLFLASRHPEIKAIVLYAPATKGDDADIKMLTGPWGRQLAKMNLGGEFLNNPDTVSIHKQYWQMHVHLDGVMAVGNFVRHTMNKETFEKITCPVFLGYYYKNEQEQDKAVNVKTMLKMFDELGTAAQLKKEESFPEAGDHVIASALITKEWKHVEDETVKWLREVVLK